MRRVTMLILLTLAAGIGCRRAAAGPTPYQQDGKLTVRVVNNNRLDIVLYVLHDGYRDRLGNAIAATTTDFELRMRVLGAGRDFQLLADPVGGRQPIRTEVLHARDGLLVTWTLESDFRRSTVTVF